MTNTRKGSAWAMTALVALSLFPLGAAAQEQSDSTTTTVEIETSATSITTTTTVTDASEGERSEVPEDTLPFTGPPSQGMAGAASLALAAGMLLVVLSRRSPEVPPADTLGRD